MYWTLKGRVVGAWCGHNKGHVMSAYGMTLTTMVTELVAAVDADEGPESSDGQRGGGCDISAGLLGPALSELLRSWAELISGEARS